jgi:hypothetical protein
MLMPFRQCSRNVSLKDQRFTERQAGLLMLDGEVWWPWPLTRPFAVPLEIWRTTVARGNVAPTSPSIVIR